jgi:hypothetical protein
LCQYDSVEFYLDIEVYNNQNEIVTDNFKLPNQINGSMSILPETNCVYYSNDDLSIDKPYMYYIQYEENHGLDLSKLELSLKEGSIDIGGSESKNCMQIDQYYNNELIYPKIKSLYMKNDQNISVVLKDSGNQVIKSSTSGEGVYLEFKLDCEDNNYNLYFAENMDLESEDSNIKKILVLIAIIGVILVPTIFIMKRIIKRNK